MIYCITNQKGGVGKTTTAENLIGGLKARGYKVLAIDLDDQRTLTTTFKGKTSGSNSMSVLLGDATAEEAIQHLDQTDLIAGAKTLATANMMQIPFYSLRNALEPIKDKYDYIIIDTCPALGILTVNALAAADEVVIPVLASRSSLDALKELVETTILTARERSNPNLKISGVLLTMYNPHPKVSQGLKEITEGYAQSIGTKVFNTTIRKSCIVEEAQLAYKTLFTYDKDKCEKITKDYDAFIDELIGEKDNDGR